MTPLFRSPVFASLGRGQNSRGGVLWSVAVHAIAIFSVLMLSKMYYRSEEFRRPPTFTLVNFQPPPPSLAVERARPKQARPQTQSAAPTEPTTESPPSEAAPTVSAAAETNPIPSAEPARLPTEAAASGSAEGRQSLGPSSDIGQPRSIGSASELDNTNFSPIYNPKPAYPAIALAANIQGYVDLELVVTPTGTIESFAIINVSGHPAFGDETAHVIRRWRFPPPRINGKPVKIKYSYRVNFSLH